jgi:sucrose phosphorylase
MNGPGNDRTSDTVAMHAAASRARAVYDPEPDFTRPLFEIPPERRRQLHERLSQLYGDDGATRYLPVLERILRVHYAHKPESMIEGEKHFRAEERFTEKDLILITYGDLIKGPDRSPLKTLARLARTFLRATNTLHLLPFFPSSSDKGFAVIDFENVDPNLGTWQDVEDLKHRYRLMFDGVFNHVSSKSRWFQEFLNGNPRYADFFIAYDSDSRLSREELELITRPRTSKVLTRFEGIDGPVYVWTTFSPDQIDLNFRNPEVLMRIIEILLLYVRHGADIIRLDAVTYLWSEPGTPCANLQQTHQIIKLYRAVLDLVAPSVALITETNVPHAENIAYFGNGEDEAHVVYNFALPPLVLHTFYTEDASVLSAWADTLQPPTPTTAFFNFLDSHDGIGILGARGILEPEQIDLVVRKAEENGALISYRSCRNGGREPYEINATLFSALNGEDSREDLDLQVRRFLAARVISLVLRGVPGIYLHGLMGTQNDMDAVLATQSNRAINRTVIDAGAIVEAIADPESKLSRMTRLYTYTVLRSRHREFHPNGAQEILKLHTQLFAVLRTAPEGSDRILAVIYVSRHPVACAVPLGNFGLAYRSWRELISERDILADGGMLALSLEPYGVVWLKPSKEIAAA